jgi:hypothetical protein
MMRADLRRTAPDCECPTCRRYARAVADLDAATRERHHARRDRRAFDEARPYPVGALSRELRHAAAAMDARHVGSSTTETHGPANGPQPEGGPASSRLRGSETEPDRNRPRTAIGGATATARDGRDEGEGEGDRERIDPQ